MNLTIYSNKQRLDNLYTKVGTITQPQDQVEWSKYLCVLTAGYIEESFRLLLLDFSKNHSSLPIQRFLEKEISFITNCKTERILEVLRKFDSAWATRFETEIESRSPINTEIKDSIDGIVINRHKIAHGKSVGISYVTVRNYYQFCVVAVQILESTIR